MANPIVTFEMENGDVIKAELYPETAPNTVNNFISLVNKGFYDGLIFHRVIRGFMIQGGMPAGYWYRRTGISDQRRVCTEWVSESIGAYKGRAVYGESNASGFRRVSVLYHA